MKKSYINVPEGIKYLSGWKEFFSLIPLGSQFILDKRIRGCGATEAFLRSSDFKVILASPRKHLLYNKYSQHLEICFYIGMMVMLIDILGIIEV